MSGPQYGSPVFDNGMYSPPPSAKPPTINLASPAPGMALPAHFTQMHPPPPNPHQQMTVYHHGMQVASPPQMNTTPASPYPTPSSQSSIDVSSSEYQEFLAYKRQQQQQQFSQPPPNMMTQPPQVFSYGRQQQDSGYGTSQFETLGQQHGLPRQQPIYGQGHTYGTVTATGNARVIRGNVRDPEIHPGTQNLPVKRHIYGKSDYSGDSMAIEGDVTSNAARQLWGRD